MLTALDVRQPNVIVLPVFVCVKSYVFFCVRRMSCATSVCATTISVISFHFNECFINHFILAPFLRLHDANAVGFSANLRTIIVIPSFRLHMGLL